MNTRLIHAGVVALTLLSFTAHSQQATELDKLEEVLIVAARDNRISKGATGLPLEIKDTPQTISIIDEEDMENFGATGVNDALRLGTGINVEQYETNRAVFNARGFEIQLTQIDGLGMTNSYGTVVGQQDTYLFEKIELIRGANGLLTGVGNSSGTINYVRKRPKNQDGGEVELKGGSHDLVRGAVDYNKVFAKDGSWAGRLVVTHEDKDSHLRALNDKRTTVYGVVDGQIGANGILTLGLTYQRAKQKSPMWGSLTLNYTDGSLAEFDVASSTSQDWTYWNTESTVAFIEYAHHLSDDWQAKLTYNHRDAEEDTRLLYAYSFTGGLNADNTGLYGWPYSSFTTTDNDLLDANISGQFDAFGRQHSLIAGISYSHEETATEVYSYNTATYQFLPLPAFPYAGNAYPQPVWSPKTPSSSGEQTLTRVYLASRIGLTDDLKLIGGVNAVRLEREGSSVYGAVVTGTDYPDTDEVSPYLGLTYDITSDILGYVSYSNIFQNQDQTDINQDYLDPVEGVNYEAGVKAEWFDRKLLTTFALFTSEQKGLAVFAGITGSGIYYYVPQDLQSKGAEFEATGRIGKHARLTFGLTHLDLSGADDGDIFEWVPRTTANLRFDTKIAALPQLKLGIDARWQSDVSKLGGYQQDAYLLANGFASYELTDKLAVRANINNLLDKKYVGGLAYGAIYGAPRNFALTLSYQL